MKKRIITWADLVFPPINLWSLPVLKQDYAPNSLSYTYNVCYQRWQDMYCADEYEKYFRTQTRENYAMLQLAKGEFDNIYAARAADWKHK